MQQTIFSRRLILASMTSAEMRVASMIQQRRMDKSLPGREDHDCDKLGWRVWWSDRLMMLSILPFEKYG